MLNNQLNIFYYNNANIRIYLDEKGNPWFVAKDVCDFLEIKNNRDAISDLEPDERESVAIDTNGGKQNMNIITESGVYEIILKSRKPEAQKFKSWLRKEVLPTLRKTGSYVIQQKSLLEESKELANRTLLLISQIEEKDKVIAEKTQALSIAEPKAQHWEITCNTDGGSTFNHVARRLGIGLETLYKFLRNRKILQNDVHAYPKFKGKHNLPYQKYIDEGWFFCAKESFWQSHGDNEKTKEARTKVYVTAKGEMKICDLLVKDDLL